MSPSSGGHPTESMLPGRALAFMQLLWAIAHGLESTSKRMHSRLGITGPQRLVLRLIGHGSATSAGELARLMHVHPSSLTGLLRRLEKARLVERQPHPFDGRRSLLRLTPSGRRLDRDKTGTVESVIERALATMSERDLRAAQRALQRVAKSFTEA
jgi:MarR family transcriptional regulator, organic hydroperoxide resistance regulator